MNLLKTPVRAGRRTRTNVPAQLAQIPTAATCHRGVLRIRAAALRFALLAIWVGVTVFGLTGAFTQAAPTLVSTVPVNMAAGVSPDGPIVFTFSEPMDPRRTTATLIELQSFQQCPVDSSWSGGNTVLTCTPSIPLPMNRQIFWLLDGENPAGVALATEQGMFTTGSGGESVIGCDSNAPMRSFTVSKAWGYSQTGPAAPTLKESNPYCFFDCLTLPCPESATNVSLQGPTGARFNMGLTTVPGHLTYLDCGYSDLAAYEAAYPAGEYTFTVQSAAASQAFKVNFPTSLIQPPPSHLTNYAALQAVNPSLPCVLAWDPVAGGTAVDLIDLEIGPFRMSDMGNPGGLNGTVTAFVIPANTLQPNETYWAFISFYHHLLVTNASHIAISYRCSTTDFILKTTGGASNMLSITNGGWLSGNTFSFEVPCSIGQTLTAEWNNALGTGPWQTLSQTSSLTPRVRFTDPRAATNGHLFYRVRTGP